jgi:hypothetical protein
LSLKESILLLESPLRGRPEFDSFLFIFRDRIRSSEAAMGGGAHSAPFGVAMNPKRRVRAAHGRARVAKTHLYFISIDKKCAK